MKNIRINNLSNIDVAIKYFIDNELNAPHVYSIIFLYCLKNSEIIRDIMQICIKTNCTKEQVTDSFEYWEAKGLCAIEYSEKEDLYKINISLTQNKVEQLTHNETRQIILTENDKDVQKNKSVPETTTKTKNTEKLKKADYKPEEISYFMQNSQEIREMFKNAEVVLGKASLTHTEMNSLLDFHDRLKLPFDVIELMLEYCAMNNKRNIRYIANFAQNLSDQDINTLDKFNIYVNKNKEIYKEILTALNASNKMATKSQIEIIDKWFKEMSFTLDVILEACDKACINTGNPTLRYVDGILKNWQKANIKTVLDVQEYELKYLENKDKVAETKKKVDFKNVKTKPSNFNNFEGHKRNYDDITKKLRI